MVGVRLDSTGHDGLTGVLGEPRAGDEDVRRAEPDSGRVRVGVVADADADRADSCVDVVGQRHVVRRRHLDGGGHLVPGVAGALEQPAAERAGREGVGWALVVADQEGAGLLARVALVGVRPEPRRAGERDAGEPQVVRWSGVRAADLQQCLQTRQLDVDPGHVLAVLGLVVDLPGLLVQVPLPGFVEELSRVHEVERPCAERALRGVPAPGVVVPRRLCHGHVVVGDLDDR
jgi:hypothetical protein